METGNNTLQFTHLGFLILMMPACEEHIQNTDELQQWLERSGAAGHRHCYWLVATSADSVVAVQKVDIWVTT